jgi:hypothetical protein
MDPISLVEAIGKHLDVLEKISLWAFLLSLAVGWAGLQGEEITALGMKFKRREAFFAAAFVYMFANVITIILFLRLGDLLLLLGADDRMFSQALTKLATHTWLMNPFAYFGGDGSSRLYEDEGAGLLIALWCFCSASLTTLIEGRRNIGHKILIGAFLLAGVSAVGAAGRIGWIVCRHRSDSLLRKSIASTIGGRIGGMLLGVIFGGLLLYCAPLFKRRFLIWRCG